MKLLNLKIRDYIVDRSIGSFNSNNGFSRLLVKGIPYNIALSFVNEIIGDGGFKINGRIIPIVLFDKKIESSTVPDSPLGGICGKDHVLNLRNSITITEIIVLLSEGSSLDKSNTTSFDPIGINEDVLDDDWVEHDLIQYLLKEILSENDFPYRMPEFAKSICDVLVNFRSNRAHQGDHFDQWELIKNISESVQKGSIPKLRATLGLVNDTDDIYFSAERSIEIFNRIADAFENSGVQRTVLDWCESDHSSVLKNALTEFGNHINSVCDSISSFRMSPYFYYRGDCTPTSWWQILTTDAWNEILDESIELKGGGKVEILNSIFKTNIPCPIVLDEPKFRYYNSYGIPSGSTILVLAKKLKYEIIETITLEQFNTEILWSDTPRSHQTPLNYKFQLDGYKDTSVKFISLYHYEPGLVFDFVQTEKATVFKKISKNGNKKQEWSSTVQLSNSGTHEIEFVWDDKRFSFDAINFKPSISEDQSFHLSPENIENKGTVTFDVEGECLLEIKLKRKNDNTLSFYKINIIISDTEPTGVTSTYEKLILQNRSKKGLLEKVKVYSTWNKLHQLQKWISENHDISHYPILLGSDFNENFKRPNWDKGTPISSAELIIDCRPLRSQYAPPQSLVEVRSDIIKLICQGTGNNESDYIQPLLEYKELFTKGIMEQLHVLITKYLTIYIKWFSDDPENATWWDTIALCDISNSVLDSEPFAIILNPFHPIRLGWQYQSQCALIDSLNQKIPCPAASLLDASKFPDSIALPCFKPEGQNTFESFFSIGSSSHYWSVLWNSQKIALLSNNKLLELFSSGLGLQIHGLDGGLSATQVEQTLSDLFRIKSGQNTINVEVQSESTTNQMFNDGIKIWVEKHLGEDRLINNKRDTRDIWYSSGSRKLSIYDTRSTNEQPTSEELVDMTLDSGFNLKWFSREHPSKQDNLDLTILSHLSNQSPQAIVGELSSVVFNGGISRQRIRYATKNSQEKLTFTESRTYSMKANIKFKNELERNFIDAIYALENEVFVRKFGHLNSTPKLSIVYEKLKKSDYCAVSSSAVDPSAFFDSDGKNYLWDYDLPAYGDKQSSNSGFYLLAKNSETIVNSVRKSLKTIPGLGNVGNETVQNILKEISGRGIPTLKTLASGGASANGEIGMLTAMSLLQNFRHENDAFQLFPSRLGYSINLLIPIDPFQYQLNSLQEALGIDRMRPDLLALSFCYRSNEVSNIKITPIEIKYRSSPLDRKQLISALTQCSNFNKFFLKLLEHSKRSTIWDNARCRFFSDLISFSFSIYGRRLVDMNEIKNWSLLQSKLLNAFNDHDAVKVCDRGRLIVISDYSVTEFEKLNSDTKYNVLKLAFTDARDLLLSEKLEKFNKLHAIEKNWGLISDCNFDNKNDFDVVDEIVTDHILADEHFKRPNELQASHSNSEDELTAVKKDINNYINQNDGIKFTVGNHEGALQSIPYLYHPSNTNLNQLNIGIVGDLGTGKTQLIKALVYNISKFRDQNRGESPKFLIMDTKRDYDGSGEKESDKQFLLSINAKVIKPYKLPINLFDIRNSREDNPALSKAEFFIDILKKIFGGIGPNQENTILTSVLSAFDLRGYEPYRDDYSSFLSPTLNDIFEQYKLQIGDKIDTPYSIMNKLILSKFFEDDPTKTIDFKDFFKTSLILSLGGIASNDRNLKTLMIIFMNVYRDYMLGVKKYEFLNYNDIQLRKIDSYLLIDEANLIMEYELPVLEDLLLKGREFGVGIILSSQYLSHFKKSGTNYIEPLLTWFLHKVPNISVKELQSLGLTNADEGTVQKIKTMEQHFCLYKGLNSPGVIIKGIPFYKLYQE